MRTPSACGDRDLSLPPAGAWLSTRPWLDRSCDTPVAARAVVHRRRLLRRRRMRRSSSGRTSARHAEDEGSSPSPRTTRSRLGTRSGVSATKRATTLGPAEPTSAAREGVVPDPFGAPERLPEPPPTRLSRVAFTDRAEPADTPPALRGGEGCSRLFRGNVPEIVRKIVAVRVVEGPGDGTITSPHRTVTVPRTEPA